MKSKYPRTPHVLWSNGIEDDDLVLHDYKIFNEKPVIITEKLDGEHITISKDTCYLQYRSLDLAIDSHIMHQIKSIQDRLPEKYVLHGEYLYINHSIEYTNLSSYLVFYYVQVDNTILNWNSAYDVFRKLDVSIVYPLYRGIFNLDEFRKITLDCDNNNNTEGVVLRLDCNFELQDISICTAKYVRKGFKQKKITDLNEFNINYLAK